MFNTGKQDKSRSHQDNTPQENLSHGAHSSVEQSDNTSWQTVNFPGTIAVDQIPGPVSHLRTNAMDSSSTSSINGTPGGTHPRETELLNLVRDLNECNDVLLAKVSQLEESLERSQAALQAEIDRSGGPVGDRETAHLITELEQSNQALQTHQMLNETLQTELSASQDRLTQLEAEHTSLLRQHTEQSQALLQANTGCRDLRARLQRQQRYTLQFKAALEKCLSMSAGASPKSSGTVLETPGLTMPKTEQIRPWESNLVPNRLDPQLESMIRGAQASVDSPPAMSIPTSETEAEDQLWHDLARVMVPTEEIPKLDNQNVSTVEPTPPAQFTEPSPWGNEFEPTDSAAEDDATPLQISPQAEEILARVQAAGGLTTADTYLPAMSVQTSPSPLVNPLKPQKRIGSLAAVDLPSFPRLKKPSKE